jgi:nitroreductase
MSPITVPEDQLRAAVEAATLSPSLHNSQPWWFHENSDGIDVHTDAARNPTVVDPTGREMHIGCGSATLFARLALRSFGWNVDTALLPDPGDATLVARLRVTGEAAETDDERLLIDALPIRYTDRGRYEARQLPADLVTELHAAVEAEGGWLRILDRAKDGPAVAVLLSRADTIERADPAYVAELESWSRFDDSAPDGVPRSAVDPTPVERRGSDYQLRDFDVDGTVSADYAATDDPPEVERPLVAVLGTPSDDPRSWLEAGMALGHLLLRAAADGVTGAPMTQVLEVPSARLQLGHALGVVGHPQMLLRLGYGTGQPTTHRRPVDDVVH